MLYSGTVGQLYNIKSGFHPTLTFHFTKQRFPIRARKLLEQPAYLQQEGRGMRTIIGLSLAVLLGPITAQALPVTVGANEWMQPKETNFTTWLEIAEVCDPINGICDGIVTSDLALQDLTGWIWASGEEIGALLATLTPYPGGIATYSEVDSDWAPLFFDLFDSFAPSGDGSEVQQESLASLSIILTSSARQHDSSIDNVKGEPTEDTFDNLLDFSVLGWSRTSVEEDSSRAYFGGVGAQISTGGAALASLDMTNAKEGREFGIGGWFYRPASMPVPEPGTLTLLVLGFAGFVLVRRRHGQQF